MMTDEQREAIKALDALEMTLTEIARIVHVSRDTVRRVIDPEYGAIRQVRNRRDEGRRLERLSGGEVNMYRGRVEADARILQRKIPEDDRTLTGRLLGDPMGDRSALAQRQGRAG